ncbi:hypothetical protein V2J09_021508 [Rumex salicifolius]
MEYWSAATNSLHRFANAPTPIHLLQSYRFFPLSIFLRRSSQQPIHLDCWGKGLRKVSTYYY